MLWMRYDNSMTVEQSNGYPLFVENIPKLKQGARKFGKFRKQGARKLSDIASAYIKELSILKNSGISHFCLEGSYESIIVTM